MNEPLRILSLLPAATEIVYLLGLEKYLVGVSYECDYPPEAKSKPKVTFSEVSNAMNSNEIDEKVKKIGHRGPGVFHIKEGILRKLKPNLILTQELCSICAIGFNQARKAVRILDGETKIVSLEPESVEDILENIRIVGENTRGGKEANRVVRNLRKRLDILNRKIATVRSVDMNVPRNDVNPKVLVIEWLDPIMAAGHWVPEMIKFAGGKHLITKAGERSKKINIYQIRSRDVDILIVSPCGFDIERIIRERFMINDLRLKINNKKLKVYLVDGNSYMTRPGPRIIDGIEILTEILHPEIFPKKHSDKDWTLFK